MSKLVDHVPNLLVTLDFAPGKVIRNPEYAKFFLWNPEYLALETGIRACIGIRNPFSKGNYNPLHFSSHYEILGCTNLEWSTFQLYAKHHARLSETPVPEIQEDSSQLSYDFFCWHAYRKRTALHALSRQPKVLLTCHVPVLWAQEFKQRAKRGAGSIGREPRIQGKISSPIFLH